MPPIVQFPQLPPNVLPAEVVNAGAVELGGIANTRMFDPKTNAFSQVGAMHHSRWYPSAVILPDGKVFVGTGVRKSQHNDQPGQVRQTETFDPATRQWTENGNSVGVESSLPLYAGFYLAPNGKIFCSGSGQGWAPGGSAPDELTWRLQKFFDLRTHQWQLAGAAARSPLPRGTPTEVPLPTGETTRTATLRSVPTEVMLPMHPPYDTLRILMAGGVAGPSPDTVVALPLSETYTVDRAGNVAMQPTGNMNHPRWAGQGVTLPTGEVVAFNGADREEPFAPATERAIRQMEIYDPVLRAWRPGALAARDRTYHTRRCCCPTRAFWSAGTRPRRTCSAGSMTIRPAQTTSATHPLRSTARRTCSTASRGRASVASSRQFAGVEASSYARQTPCGCGPSCYRGCRPRRTPTTTTRGRWCWPSVAPDATRCASKRHPAA